MYQMQHMNKNLIIANAYSYENANERQPTRVFCDSFGEQTITNINNLNLNTSTMQTITPEQSQTPTSAPHTTTKTHI
jgi:hypothetical protein